MAKYAKDWSELRKPEAITVKEFPVDQEALSGDRAGRGAGVFRAPLLGNFFRKALFS